MLTVLGLVLIATSLTLMIYALWGNYVNGRLTHYPQITRRYILPEIYAVLVLLLCGGVLLVVRSSGALRLVLAIIIINAALYRLSTWLGEKNPIVLDSDPAKGKSKKKR